MSYRGEEPEISGINVTPLVDVVLVLLVIFMVTAPAIARRGIGFEEAKTRSGGPISTNLELTIDRERTVYLNGLPVGDLDALGDTVAEKVDENPQVKALITVDVNVPHGDVMALIDAVKVAGVTKFAFASQALRPQ